MAEWSSVARTRAVADAQATSSRPMALVDVELFVSSGAPRAAFTVRPTEVGAAPTFDLNRRLLEASGWDVDESALRPPEECSMYLIPPPHPYALGPRWTGVNCWRADFGDEMVGIVDHDWCSEGHEHIDGGPPVASGSPWRWAFFTRTRQVAGRAESPLHAAAVVEAMALKDGSPAFVRSPSRTAFALLADGSEQSGRCGLPLAVGSDHVLERRHSKWMPRTAAALSPRGVRTTPASWDLTR